jgi:thiol:disulfide interchange protein DsbC
MKKILGKRKDIVFYIKLYPLPMHKGSYDKAKAIVCENYSPELLDKVFEKQELPKPNCETSVLDDNIKLAQKLGITGTPALILPDGTLISGYMEADALIKKITNQ